MSIRLTGAFLLLLATATAACTSADEKAATAAGLAESAYNDGRLPAARAYIQQALAQRDNVSEYWALLAQINVATGDASGAFDAYENVLTLDRGNVEALSTLLQLGLAGNAAGRAERYADQLAVLDPSSTLPATVKAAAALDRGDKETTDRLLAQVLDKHPDDVGALLVKSRRLAADQRYGEGAALIEATFKAGGNTNSRLVMLKDLYRKAKDRDRYRDTVARLAAANPTKTDMQLEYADVLYDGGARDQAYALTRALLAAQPRDLAMAADVLNLWLRQGGAAMPVVQVATDAAGLGPVGKAAYAQYASEIGHPDVALAIFDADPPTGPPDTTNSDALAAVAYARGLLGQRPAALATLAAILQQDPEQPRALLARGRLRPDLFGAVTDVRKVVAEDPANVAARLTLADLLLRRGDGQLAENVLREGLDIEGGDPRLAERLARLLVARGRRSDAVAMLTDYARANPLSRRAAALRAPAG